jgi:plasmid rolling circle replication initiator protein Rep
MTQVDEYHILNPLQHGFHKSKSCQKKSIEFIDDVSKNLENDKTERCLNNKAFVYIWAVVLLLSEIRAIIYDLDVILHLVSACIIS